MVHGHIRIFPQQHTCYPCYHYSDVNHCGVDILCPCSVQLSWGFICFYHVYGWHDAFCPSDTNTAIPHHSKPGAAQHLLGHDSALLGVSHVNYSVADTIILLGDTSGVARSSNYRWLLLIWGALEDIPTYIETHSDDLRHSSGLLCVE